jgi:hypothetical protein
VFVEKVITTTLVKTSEGSTCWSMRTLAKELGVSHGSMDRSRSRILTLAGRQRSSGPG